MRSLGFAKGGVEWVELEVPAVEWNAGVERVGSGFPAIVEYGRTLGIDVKRFGCAADELVYWIQGTRL